MSHCQYLAPPCQRRSPLKRTWLDVPSRSHLSVFRYVVAELFAGARFGEAFLQIGVFISRFESLERVSMPVRAFVCARHIAFCFVIFAARENEAQPTRVRLADRVAACEQEPVSLGGATNLVEWVLLCPAAGGWVVV